MTDEIKSIPDGIRGDCCSWRNYDAVSVDCFLTTLDFLFTLSPAISSTELHQENSNEIAKITLPSG